MTEITPKQAIEFFNKHGYLVIDSMRQTGKTQLLYKIIELNQDKEIGILCPTLSHYHFHFNLFQNCTFIQPKNPNYKHFDIILGDEIHVEPTTAIKTACVSTKKYLSFSLRPTDELLDKIEDIKRSTPQYSYEVEFGQYI